MPTLSHTTMQWPVRLLPYTLFLLLYVLGCRGQTPEVPPPPPPPLPPVTYPAGIYRPEDLGINYHYNTCFVFWDGKKVIDSISNDDIARKSPYQDMPFKSMNGSRDSVKEKMSGRIDLSKLSIKQKQQVLSNISTARPIPIDSLKQANRYHVFPLIEYNLNTLIIGYSFILYKGSSSEFGAENWSETTLHIYNKQGVIDKTMVLNENLTRAWPTKDGQYLISKSEAARFGDAESGIVDGVWLYDLHKGKTIGKIPMESKFFYIPNNQFGADDIQIDDGFFLIYVGVLEELYNDPIHFEKIIIDPSKRKVYKKKMGNADYYNLVNGGKDYPTFKVKEEDLSTYTSVRL
jgi:hypothetical protein